MTKILVLGCDPSLSNMAFAKMQLDLDTLDLELLELSLIQTEKLDRKMVRASSSDLSRAQEIHRGLHAAAKGCKICFSEIPSGGSKSAAATKSLAISVGVLASCPVPIVQVQPKEVKMASVGIATATKKQMIDWAFNLYPNANWLRARGKSDGELIVDNEHMADAVAATHAGILTNEFQSIRTIVRFSPDR